jgi:ribonuclease HIII
VKFHLAGEVSTREPSGPAESYRVEIRKGGQRLTITQYTSGTLMIQGLSSSLFEEVCEILDEHLAQSFAARAARFIPGETERAAATPYLESPDAENEAARWLFEQIDKKVLDFLYQNDQRTLLAAAGVRNAFQKSSQPLPDYSVVVMPFAKPYEGFLIKLAAHLGLTTEDALSQKANAIEVGPWLETIKARLPDIKRYSEMADTLLAAWGCRHKAIHSDFAYSLSVLKSFAEADREISTILRAIARAHRVFADEGVKLVSVQVSQEGKTRTSSEADHEYKYEKVDLESLRKHLEADGFAVQVQAEGRKHIWEIIDRPNLTVVAPRSQEGLVVVKGKKADDFRVRYAKFLEARPIPTHDEVAEAWIGIDESGKGDVFGPLVVAAVLVTPDLKITLARRGVRDSKTLSDIQVAELARFIKEICQFEILTLLPPDYNAAYEKHGRNLNRLLAWGHAQLIAKLSRRVTAGRAISDQFGDESLLIEALATEGCSIPLEQRPRAESDIAVASASVLARAEFVATIDDYSLKADLEIPLGASAAEIKRIGKMIYRRWGKRGLERIAKMHFKTVAEIISEG